MDKVRIEAIETRAVIGVYEFEHEAPQPLVLDLELTTDFTRAFTSDDLQDALDYDAITRHVRSFCEASRYQLIEALAGGIITQVMEHYPVDKVAVTIRKPKALTNALATVWCERTRTQMMGQE
ncbi:dihydroneopterin aldolase [Salinisphaera sp. G21_0]|uniref:dihydroneopterin aldolase n=1 Tax=Salinisphaera sp. G21_0 TaxID=2821094 RepID=UPI001ADC9193|nr:dihydroneopterin aldolase [Salinisphaera sp. G21_0]MBO9482753.1 dihydroneopterin aldolase [Salinisphaera sp. G21_0]